MPDQNPIYDFMKSNKLTDLDEKTFINKYSAPDKAKEIYSFMVENKLTDLDESKFYDKYLKKKVGGAESSLTELSSKGFSPEQINLLQTGAKPPKPVGKTGGTTIIPTNLTPDQKAYERELKRQGAAINTLKNIYSQKGLKFDEKSKRGQEQVLGLLEKEKNNDLTLVTGKDQKPYLVRGEGFLESAGKGILRSITEPIESTKINFTNDPNELADLLDEKIKEEPNVPESAPTKFGGYLGGLAGGLPKMMALLAIPVAGESAMVGEMYHNALANQRRALYERGLQEGMDRPTAAMNAMKNAPITAIPDAIVGAAMARGIGGKAAGAEIIPNAAKESFLKATGNGLKGVAKVSGIGGAAEYGRSKVEQQLGYKVTDAEAIENGLRGMGEYAIMDAAFKLAHAGPKYLSSAAKNLLSTVPKEVLEVAAEKYPDGKQTLEDVAKFSETKAKVQDFVPEEKVGAVTGLTEKVQNLENNIKELEEKKKTSSQALHPFMDGWIKEYQDEIDFYKKQVDKVVKSKDPTGVSEEIDDITGLKAGQEPAVVEEKVEDITQFPETLKAKRKPLEKVEIENESLKKEISDIEDEKYLRNYDIFSKRGFAKEFGFDKVPEEGADRVKYLKYRNEYLDAVLTNLDFGAANKKYPLSNDYFDLYDKIESEYEANQKELQTKGESYKKEVKPTEEKVASKEFFYIPVNGKIYKTNKTSAESNWAIKSINGEYIVDEVVGDNEYIIKRPESLVKPLFDEANVSSPDDKIFITKPAKLRKNADGTFDIVEKGEIYYGKEAPKSEVKPTEVKITDFNTAKNKEELTKAVKDLVNIDPYSAEYVDTQVRSALMTPGEFERGKQMLYDRYIDPILKYKKEVKTEEVKPTEVKEEQVTFKTPQGQKLQGERIELPGYEDIDMVLVRDGFENRIYELASGLELGDTKGAFSKEDALKSLREELLKRNVSSEKIKNALFKGEKIKQINPSKIFESYAEERKAREKGEYENLPLAYSSEEISRLDKIKQEAKDLGLEDSVKEIDNAIARKSKEGSYKPPVEFFEKMLERETERKLRNEAESNKKPYPEKYIQKLEGTEEELAKSIQVGKKDKLSQIPADVRKSIVSAWAKFADLRNKYGYNVSKSMDDFTTSLLRYSGTLNARENRAEKLLAEQKKLKSSIEAINKLHESEFKTKENAIQEPSASSVLQYPQEGVGETRGERKRVEPGIKGEKVTEKGKQAKGDEKVAPKKTYQEALQEKIEAEKKQTRQAAGEKAAASRRIFDRVFKMDAPEDAEQIALRYLADGGKVSKEAIDEAYGSVKRAQLNVKRRELLSEEVKSKDFAGGKETLDEVAHRLWEENGQRISERDIKKALMTEIGNNNTRLEAAEAYLDKYSAEYQLEKEEMRLAEQYKEQYLEEQAKLEEELRKPLDEQIEGEASEEHINNLIEQYEAEIKGEDQQLRSESEGKVSAEAGKGEAVKEAPKGEEKLAQEYKEVIKKASKKAKENAKKDFVDRNFDKLVEKLKIQIKCPT